MNDKTLETKGETCGASKTQNRSHSQNNPEPFPVIPAQSPSQCACRPNTVAEKDPSIQPLTPTGQAFTGFKSFPLWGWGLLGLIALSVLIFGTDLGPGSDPGFFRREVLKNLTFIVKAIGTILPFFIISVVISAWVNASGFSDRINAVFNRRELTAILGAAVVGAAVPLCSCGVIPLIAALLAGGVPLGPVMAFWLSSPLMSPSKFVITSGVLGMHYAVARLMAAILIGAGAGYFIYILTSRGLLNNQLQGLSLSKNACCGSDQSGKSSAEVSGFWKNFWPELGSISLFLGKWLLVAFILEALIIHYVGPEWISYLLGKDQLFSIPLATAVGIPVYTSGVSAIPIVQGLLNSGMSHGAALAFLIAGPVTTIPAMTAVFALVKRQTFAIYLGAGILGSLIAGYIFQIVMP